MRRWWCFTCVNIYILICKRFARSAELYWHYEPDYVANDRFSAGIIIPIAHNNIFHTLNILSLRPFSPSLYYIILQSLACIIASKHPLHDMNPPDPNLQPIQIEDPPNLKRNVLSVVRYELSV